MKFINPLPFVTDMARAKAFYRDVIGLKVAADHGDFVAFEGGFALHDGAALLRRIDGMLPRSEPYGRDNLVLYFEPDDLDAAFARLAPQLDLIHPIRREDWGGRVFRARDPDGHVLEFGEAEGN